MPINTVKLQRQNSVYSAFKSYSQYNSTSKGNQNSNNRIRTYSRKISDADKAKAFVGSFVGTLIPVILMMKKQGVKNPFKLEYNMWNMIGVAGGSIAGGVGLGLIGEEKEVQKNRLKEGLFQLMNVAIPAWVVGGVVSLCENSKKFNNKQSKILSVIGGLLVGMHGSAALANIITDPKDKYPDRKLTPKDALANIDDGIGALTLAKLPIAEKLNITGFLPAVYLACGYRAGQSN